jgi:hypothetical protein
MSADAIVAGATLAWDIIKSGEASADIETSTAMAIPDVDDWHAQTSDTRGPAAMRIHYANSFLWPLDDYVHVEFEILLKWQYGARYRGGGAFIPNIWTEVPQLFVGWPWNADIRFVAHHPTNAGTADAPLAAIPVTVRGTVGSGAELHHVEWGFVLYGNGNVDTV